MEFTMNYGVIAAAVMGIIAFAASPASSKMMSCSGADLSKMTTMIGGMPDGPQKWEMYKHLARVNTAMAKDGMRGCDMTMMKMMKSGM
jgi:hypothetical protein